MKINNQELSPEECNHFTLLAEAFFKHLEYNLVEFGGLGLDNKRPFGNSYVEKDIFDIIGMDLSDCDKEENENYARWLYSHLKEFLQKTYLKDNSNV